MPVKRLLPLDREHPDTRILMLIKRERLLEFDDQTGALMLDDKLPMIELREHIRTAAARKRGPRRFHRPRARR